MGEESDILISYDQAVKIMAVGSMLKNHEIAFKEIEEGDADAAHDIICDASEEIALQIAGYPDGSD